MYLLDTNVVSELRKVYAAAGDLRVKAWSESLDADTTFLSVITVMELEHATLLMERRDKKQGALLRAWLNHRILREYEGRILPIDLQIATRCAALQVPHPRPYRDSLIAATALVHGMTIVTRNLADFEPTGVALLNPWES